MREEAERQADGLDQLVAEFPRIFSTGRPAWSDLPPGWKLLARRMLRRIVDALPEGQTIDVQQVKEKYGGLRFYWRYRGEETLNIDAISQAGPQRIKVTPAAPSDIGGRIDQIVDEAEDESLRTCDRCGEPGTLNRNGWWRVRCEACEQAR